jgi:Protein of unknown function (DUF1360)
MRSRLTVLDLAVDTAAVYRLTRLVITDEVTRPIRDRIIAAAYRSHSTTIAGYRAAADLAADLGWSTVADLHAAGSPGLALDQHPPRTAYLLRCPWCVGIWAAAAVTAARWLTPRIWAPAAWTLTVSTGPPALTAAFDR